MMPRRLCWQYDLALQCSIITLCISSSQHFRMTWPFHTFSLLLVVCISWHWILHWMTRYSHSSALWFARTAHRYSTVLCCNHNDDPAGPLIGGEDGQRNTSKTPQSVPGVTWAAAQTPLGSYWKCPHTAKTCEIFSFFFCSDCENQPVGQDERFVSAFPGLHCFPPIPAVALH